MMNIQKAFKILSKDIEEIENILEGFQKSDPEERILLQLVLSKLSNLRDNFRLMSASFPEQSIDAPQPGQDKEIIENKGMPIDTGSDDVSTMPRQEPIVAQQHTEHPENDEPVMKKETSKAEPERSITQPPTPSTTEKAKTILSDKYQHNQYRNESLAKKKKGKDLSTKLQEQPIRDIYKSIAVNERFRYVKELFKGDGDAFHQTIQTLNESASLDEAEQYISDHFEWDRNNELVQQLFSLVQRKLKSKAHG